jgi:glycerophosphoryl diester phosphodiesterase
MLMRRITRRRIAALTVTAGALASGAIAALGADPAPPETTLLARAVLPAETFASGPTSGGQLGASPINGIPVPFVNKQPVQGFSAVLDNKDGTFTVMADNGYGAIENSSDFNLRLYDIKPGFKTAEGGPGTIKVLGFTELRDPDKKVPFAITNSFTKDRVLTGADFDIESIQRVKDGTYWIGDEFGPFLLHVSKSGKVLDPPVPLPDVDNPGKEIRSPQNPFNEEASAVRVMNAVRTHARLHGNTRTPVFSPWNVLLDDGDPTTAADTRPNPPAGSGLHPASSEIFNVSSLKQAGYSTVTWTVDDSKRMTDLMKLKVDGIISDRPDLLYTAVKEFDANGDGTPGDFLMADGRIDPARFDAQGHRGGRNLRPENTLPAMEVGLDNLMTTLETDTGITADRTPVLDHDPYVEAAKCRRADGAPYELADQILVKDLTVAQIQSRFICDKVFRGPTQLNGRSLSPVAVSYTAGRGLADPYVMPTLQQLFDFVDAYVAYYKTGAGSSHPMAEQRWKNAERVRFNIETKVNPRSDTDELGNVFAERTIGPKRFARTVAGIITDNHLADRADIQSFDFRTLLEVQERFPAIRTVYLFGDFPKFADPAIAGSDDGTNLQPQGGTNTPWLAGLFWPYLQTVQQNPFRAARSGGFEGMALTTDGKKLIPLLELPLVGGAARTLVMSEFDLASKHYTGTRWTYPLDARGTNIGDFIMTGRTHGLVIERDGSQGRLDGFKTIQEVTLPAGGGAVTKRLAVDLITIADPNRISEPGLVGDVGLGTTFAFPFTTIEDVVLLGHQKIGVLNDNNFPFSVGRHVGSGRPDDNEFVVLKLDRPVGSTD